MADKARLRRARHKGGYVPSTLKKVQVEYFEDDEDGNPKEKKGDASDDEEDLGASLADKGKEDVDEEM